MLGPDEGGSMVSTRTIRSCETLLRNSNAREREYGCRNLGGSIERFWPLLGSEEVYRRFGRATSSSQSGFIILEKHILRNGSGATEEGLMRMILRFEL